MTPIAHIFITPGDVAAFIVAQMIGMLFAVAMARRIFYERGAMVESQLHGNTKFDWHPEGLRCTLSLPSGNEATQPAVSSRDAMVHDAILLSTELAANKVMLVEDDFLVAMMMKDMLTELGLVVLGPFGTAAEAIAAAQYGEFDVAVLDINLGGEPVYPVADLLVGRGVPLIFVSGYGPEGVDKRFAKVPILQKPIELRTLQNVFTTVLNDSAKRVRELLDLVGDTGARILITTRETFWEKFGTASPAQKIKRVNLQGLNRPGFAGGSNS